MRADLLALTDDDLVALSNRGTVRRARAELEAGAPAVELAEAADGTVTASWSDQVACTLAPGKGLAAGLCTCPAEPPCRPLVRTVMAYREWLNRQPSAVSGDGELPANAHSAALPVALEQRARKRFAEGQLFELTRGKKPVARCHSLGVVTRFLVAVDPHHTVCDCGDPAPCEHAVMAAWAFERLAPTAAAGLVDSREGPYPVPSAALELVEAQLEAWARVGVSDAPPALVDGLRHADQACRKAGVVWLAEGLDELVSLKAAYDARDARFDAARLAQVIGELVVRTDTIRADRGVIPPVFVRGAPVDRPVEISSARLVGLGAGVRVRRASLVLTAYLQSEDTGQVVCFVREVAHGPAEPKPIAEIARAPIGKGISFADAAAGRLVAKGGKRTAGGVLSLGRAPAACQPQAFAWESLRAPVLVESFAELDARLRALPPRSLRPRRLAEDVHVLAVSAVSDVGFDRARQVTLAQLHDAEGAQCTLSHPFLARASAGTDALLAALGAGTVCFVSGRVSRSAAGLVVEPFGVVVDEGGARRLVSPWLAPLRAESSHALETTALDAEPDPARLLAELLPGTIGDLLVAGHEARTPAHARALRELARFAESLGFVELPAALLACAESPAAPDLLALAAFACLADRG